MSEFNGFLNQIRARLEAGAREYGDASLAKPVSAVIREALEEAWDVPGWLGLAIKKMRPEDAYQALDIIAKSYEIHECLERLKLKYEALESVPVVTAEHGSEMGLCQAIDQALADGLMTKEDAKACLIEPQAGQTVWSDGVVTDRYGAAYKNGSNGDEEFVDQLYPPSTARVPLKCDKCGASYYGPEGSDYNCKACGGGMTIRL